MKLSQVLRALRRVYGSGRGDLTQRDAAWEAARAGYPLKIDGDTWSKLEREDRETTFERARIILRAFGVDVKFVDLEGNDVEDALRGVLDEIERRNV